MRCLVTGVAGFIGSHLAERLLELGHDVVGIDAFIDYYPRQLKEKNLAGLRDNNGFRFIEADLNDMNLEELVEDCELIFHQAAQAGVRASWGKEFRIYTDCNIKATQALLEACLGKGIKKFVYASSSSVYGDTPELPMREVNVVRPVSPYGVTKLAGEHLACLYAKNFGLPCVSLRYFTVYGPRQRPDMAFHRFITACMENRQITVYGDGEQTRDFTYISDIIDANIQAVQSEAEGEVFNIGGGSRVSLNQVLSILERVANKKIPRQFIETQKGDVRHTYADVSKARMCLGYKAKVTLEKGLKREFEWFTECHARQ
ncbi:MAG: NAD-dependent epimerase/dehydratase family protein [bacterium]